MKQKHFLISLTVLAIVWGIKRSVKVGVWHIGIETF
jgi:hypothetical protein